MIGYILYIILICDNNNTKSGRMVNGAKKFLSFHNRGWDGWMASLTWWIWVWVTPGAGDGWGVLACCSPWGCRELDMTKWLNWTEYKHTNLKLRRLQEKSISDRDIVYNNKR